MTGPSVDAAYRGLRGDDVKAARLGLGPGLSSCESVHKDDSPGTTRCKRSDLSAWQLGRTVFYEV